MANKKSNKSKTIFWVACCLPVVWMLSGCSPHPGSGSWLASENNSDDFVQLQVHFDGKAELHYADDKQGELHCFWQAFNQETLDMICTKAGDEDARLRFQLQVEGESHGKLHREGELVGRFDRQPWQ